MSLVQQVSILYTKQYDLASAVGGVGTWKYAETIYYKRSEVNVSFFAITKTVMYGIYQVLGIKTSSKIKEKPS